MTLSPRRQEGLSLTECALAIAMLVGLSGLLSRTISHQVQGHLAAQDLGKIEDIRQYLRKQLDCQQTVRREAQICRTGGNIKGSDASGNPLMDDANTGRAFGGFRVTLQCTHDGQGSLINGTVLRSSSNQTRELFSIPVACADMECMPEATWGDPMTFPTAAEPRPFSHYTIWQIVHNRLLECTGRGLPRSPANSGYDHALLRAVDEPERGKDSGFNNGTEMTHSLRTYCNILGYRDYVRSTCEDDKAGESNRCNWTSPGGNSNTYFNNSLAYEDLFDTAKPITTLWPRTNRAYYQSWVVTITCSGKKV